MPRPPLATLALLFGLVSALAACRVPGAATPDRDLDAIVASDTLHVLLTSNSTSYFVYRGEPLGFEFDLLRAFAADQDLTMKLRVTTPDSLLPLLQAGRGDIAAGRLLPDTTARAAVRYTRPLYSARPALVQSRHDGPVLPEAIEDVIEEGAQRSEDIGEGRAPAGEALADLPGQVTLRARAIRSARELEGETVHLSERSAYTRRVIAISDSLSGTIQIVEVDAPDEALIERVAYGQFDLTVAPEALARLQADRFDNVVATPTLGEPQDVAWAVREGAPRLWAALDAWIAANDDRVQQLYRRYYQDRRAYRERAESAYLTSVTGALSPFDHLFKQHADTLDWDWRLLASVSYQESRFIPTARSWAGAAGLLQLMPATAREFGVTNVYDPADNVAGAARFFRWLKNYWENRIEDEEQRLRFILASYNTGHGHVEDARRLAARDGLDDQYWPDVAFWLLQKSNPAVYRLPVVRFGYSRGSEPVHYVEVILDRFDHYQQFQEDGAPYTAPRPPLRQELPLAGVRGVR